MGMGDHTSHVFGLSPLTVAVIGILSAATMLLAYHCIVARWFNQEDFTVQRLQRPQLPVTVTAASADNRRSSVDTSITELLPAYKYSKEIGLASKTQSGTCAVCLCEFVEGEPVRVLPDCLHPFHVPCIDMWLYSHPNCPLCRADTPSPRHSLANRLDSGVLEVSMTPEIHHQPLRILDPVSPLL